MLRCDRCKYQPLPPDMIFDMPRRDSRGDTPEPEVGAALRWFSLRIKAQRAYAETPEAQGFACHQCGHEFQLDDVRWEGDSYRLVGLAPVKYGRKEPRQIQTIRTEMYIRADNGNGEARKYLADRWIHPSEWKGFAAMKHRELMDRVFGPKVSTR